MCKGLDEMKLHLHYPADVREQASRLSLLTRWDTGHMLEVASVIGFAAIAQHICCDIRPTQLDRFTRQKLRGILLRAEDMCSNRRELADRCVNESIEELLRSDEPPF